MIIGSYKLQNLEEYDCPANVQGGRRRHRKTRTRRIRKSRKHRK